MRRPTTSVCRNEDCPVIVNHPERWCPDHKPAPWANQSASSQATRGNREWHRARAIKLRDTPACEHCSATTGLQVHHIVPIAHGGPVTDQSNLQTLCKACHNRQH